MAAKAKKAAAVSKRTLKLKKKSTLESLSVPKRKKRAVAQKGRTRSSAKRDGSSEARILRMIEALKLRCAGASYWDIGQALGVSNVQAFHDVQDLLALHLDDSKEDTEKLRALENERLDMVLQKVLPNIVNIQPDANGMIPMDEDFKSAIFSFIRLSHVRIRLNGLEPAKKAPIDAEGNAVPVQLQPVTNFLTIMYNEDRPAYNAFLKATSVNGANGGIEVKAKQIKEGKKK